jgi:hypothetical protein
MFPEILFEEAEAEAAVGGQETGAFEYGKRQFHDYRFASFPCLII